MIWLLRFYFPEGPEWFFSSEPAEPDEDGNAIFHAPTLSIPGFVESVSWGTGGLGECSASISFLPAGLDVAELHFKRGHRLDTARAELALWTPGTPYRARLKLVHGDFFPATIPILGAPVEGEVTQSLLREARLYPPSSAVATVETWADLPVEASETDDDDGLPYPLWIGAGGDYTSASGAARQRSCIRCILVDDSPDTLLVSYEHMQATTAEIWSDENNSAYTATLTATTDALGQPCTTADISGSGWTWATTAAADTFYVISITAGVRSARGTGAVYGLGDAILWLLLKRYDPQGVPEQIDIAAWEVVRPILDQIKIGLLVERGKDPLDVVVSDLLSAAPALYVAPGPSGLRPVFFAATPADECPLLIARDGDERGPDLYREEGSEPEIVGKDPTTQVVVRFARRLADSTFKTSYTLDATTHAGAAAAASWYGTRAEEVEAPALWQRASVRLLAAEILRVRGTRATSDEYFAPLDVGARLYLGQRIRVQDDDASYERRPMSVIGRELTEDGLGWLITLIDY